MQELVSSRRTLAFNLYCITGAVLGIAAIFTPWISTSAGFFEESRNLDELIRDVIFPPHIEYLVGAFSFVLGSLIAFYTPLGGSVQSAGLLIFLLAESDRQEAFRDSANPFYHGSLSFGFFLGCASAVIVLSSVYYSLLTSGWSRESSWKDKMRTFLRTRTFHIRPDTTLQDPSPAPARMVAQYKRPLSAIALMLVVALLFVAGVNYPYGPQPPLREVDGGVVMTRGSGLWDYLTISVNDSIQSVTWSATSPDLHNGTWVTHTYEPLNLGGMNITLAVIDFQGNGRKDVGDAVVLTASPGSFLEDRMYRVALTQEPFNWMRPHITYEVSFTYHDGKLKSWVSIEPPDITIIMAQSSPELVGLTHASAMR